MTKLLRDSILATLYYHDLFDFPLTKEEIKRFLIKPGLPAVCSPAKCGTKDRQGFYQGLNQLIKEKKIFKKENFYFLSSKEKTVKLRKRREKYSQGKLRIAKKIVKILQFIPWIKMIAITGALAMNNSDKDDDIDFLIITAENRLWLTRLLTVVILEILGKRRRPRDIKVKDKICLNMFLDEMSLSLSRTKHNIFTAHEIIQMKPILNRNNTYEKFLKANRWVKKYLPNSIEIKKLGNLAIKGKKKRLFSCLLPTALLFDCLEKAAYFFQLKYMKPKITQEQISPHFAFFHPKDISKKVLREYKKRFRAFEGYSSTSPPKIRPHFCA